MKKLILLLGMIAIVSLITSPVTASDRDVGYQFELSADNNAVVSTDCQAAAFSPECVIPVELRDHGDRCVELRVQSPGLRAESPAISCAFYQGDLTINKDFDRDQHGSRIYLMNKRVPVCRITSTSNGGAGY